MSDPAVALCNFIINNFDSTFEAREDMWSFLKQDLQMFASKRVSALNFLYFFECFVLFKIETRGKMKKMNLKGDKRLLL